MKNALYILMCLPAVLNSCKPAVVPIEYGTDVCSFCTMTIVDNRFGAELVTRKGKIYRFDATECLVNFLQRGTVDEPDIFIMVTNTHDRPGELMEIDLCLFLRSENLPSPMGMYINPFAEYARATDKQSEHGGDLYTFEELSEIIYKK